ncbi:alpha/beta fold hydrolase [Sulfitobacter aestuarii]|uniref:Alpha/beta fold hydrolase n=1 Tax=Sulfitobacter aestuarii TaxID=2161676 RepID=A0ABW5U3M3_9RHOB
MILALLVLLGVIALVQWRAATRESLAEAAAPPSGQMVDVDGVQVHARVLGSGPDLVMIHGASGNLRDFTFDLAQRLSPHYRVTLLDRPGLGWTARLPAYAGAWRKTAEPPREQAALLQRAADQLGVKNPIVLGHSYGGAVALAWGLTRPEETAALVLLAAVSKPWPGGLGWLYKLTGSTLGSALVIPMITAFAPKRAVESSIEAIFAPQSAPAGYEAHIGTGLTLRRTSTRANAQQVTSLRPHIVEMSQDYHRLKMPVELVHGSADTIVPLQIHSEPLLKDIPQARLTRLPGIGHMPHHANPQSVIDAIDRAARDAGLRPRP